MNFVYNTKCTRTLINSNHISTHRKRVPPIFVLDIYHRKIKKGMYAYTVGSLSHEVDKRNVLPVIEHSAEKSSKTKHDTQLDPDC